MTNRNLDIKGDYICKWTKRNKEVMGFGLFKLKENNTNVRTEIIAGVTTFMTMAYIIFVNPSILGDAGMPWEGVFMATIFATILGTLCMAF